MATKDQTLAIKSVQHIVPNYIGLYLGKDKFGRKFTGQL
jgi:hypothetical protein